MEFCWNVMIDDDDRWVHVSIRSGMRWLELDDDCVEASETTGIWE